MSEVLAREIRHALDEGVTLPPHWYFDEAIYALEQAAVFGRGWQYACHEDQVSAPGDQFPFRLGSLPLVVVRDKANELRAFVNVCRHRGHEVVKQPCNRGTLQCPYHGWTFDLDGRLRAAPREKREESFDRANFPLFAARVDTWGPFVFVNPDPSAPPLAETLSTLPEVALERELNLARLESRDRREYDCACNWKIMLDNMLECYHCPTGHPEFYEHYDVDPATYTIELHGSCSYQRGDLRSNDESQAHKQDWGDFELYFVWPNTILIPGPLSCIVLSMLPVASNRSSLVSETFFLPETDHETAHGYIDYYDRIWHQDKDLIESVQRGQESGRLRWGPFFQDSEILLRHVQRLLLADISRETSVNAAAPPAVATTQASNG